MNPSMRILTVLAVLQTIAVMALLFKFASFETEMSSSTPAHTHTVVAEAVVGKTPVYGDEDLLRKIVSEEVAGALQSLPGSRPSPESVPSTDAPDEKPQNVIDYHYRRELVQSQLGSYVSQGTISESEMTKLQMEIATLDEPGRKLMLRELTRMLSSGDLKGRL